MAVDIIPDKKYHLVSDTRGTGSEATTWDWIRLSSSRNDLWIPVIFHEYKGGRYVIENTASNWGGYKYWQLSDNGVCLNTWDPSTAWTIHPTQNGFRLGKGDDLLYLPPGEGNKKWLKSSHHASFSDSLAGIGQSMNYPEFQITPA